MEITKDYLKDLYRNNTNQEAADYLDVSIVTLLKMVDDAGIKRKGSGSHDRKKKVQIVD